MTRLASLLAFLALAAFPLAGCNTDVSQSDSPAAGSAHVVNKPVIEDPVETLPADEVFGQPSSEPVAEEPAIEESSPIEPAAEQPPTLDDFAAPTEDSSADAAPSADAATDVFSEPASATEEEAAAGEANEGEDIQPADEVDPLAEPASEQPIEESAALEATGDLFSDPSAAPANDAAVAEEPSAAEPSVEDGLGAVTEPPADPMTEQQAEDAGATEGGADTFGESPAALAEAPAVEDSNTDVEQSTGDIFGFGAAEAADPVAQPGESASPAESDNALADPDSTPAEQPSVVEPVEAATEQPGENVLDAEAAPASDPLGSQPGAEAPATETSNDQPEGSAAPMDASTALAPSEESAPEQQADDIFGFGAPQAAESEAEQPAAEASPAEAADDLFGAPPGEQPAAAPAESAPPAELDAPTPADATSDVAAPADANLLDEASAAPAAPADQPANEPAPGEAALEQTPAAPTAETPAPSSAPVIRTWTDSSGAYKIEAAFLKIENGIVHLQRADGVLIGVALDKLSAGDQAFAQQQAAK